ncbi:hypothetical protein D1872_232440 [compost metagenome]
MELNGLPEQFFFFVPPQRRYVDAVISLQPVGDPDTAVQLAPRILHIVSPVRAGPDLLFRERVLFQPIFHQADEGPHIFLVLRQPVSLPQFAHITGPVQHDHPFDVPSVPVSPIDAVRKRYLRLTAFHVPAMGKNKSVFARQIGPMQNFPNFVRPVLHYR